jgi:hypothetical protein
MEIAVSHEQGRVPITVLKVTGSLISSDDLERMARREIDSGTQYMLVDLAGVPFMATAGLRALHAMFTMLRAKVRSEENAAVKQGIAAGTYASPHLKLLNPTKHVAESLKLAGYDMFLEIYHDRAKAIASF